MVELPDLQYSSDHARSTEPVVRYWSVGEVLAARINEVVVIEG